MMLRGAARNFNRWVDRLYAHVTLQKRNPGALVLWMLWPSDHGTNHTFLLTPNLQVEHSSRRKSRRVSKGPQDDHHPFSATFRRWVKKWRSASLRARVSAERKWLNAGFHRLRRSSNSPSAAQ